MKAALEDQIEELKGLFNQVDPEQFFFLGLTKSQRRLFVLLMRREFVPHEAAFAAIYYDRHTDKRPASNSMNVILNHMRNRLKKFGVSIETRWGEGHYMTQESKMKVLSLKPEPIKIDKGIPVPNRARYPFAQMEVGDSFFAPEIEKSATILSAAQNFRRDGYKNWRFVTKKVEGGIRVWRTEDKK